MKFGKYFLAAYIYTYTPYLPTARTAGVQNSPRISEVYF